MDDFILTQVGEDKWCVQGADGTLYGPPLGTCQSRAERLQQDLRNCLQAVDASWRSYLRKDDDVARYDRGGMVGMEVVRAYLGRDQYEGFLRGNALKYLMRYDYKGGVRDLRKAQDYVMRLVALCEEEES